MVFPSQDRTGQEVGSIATGLSSEALTVKNSSYGSIDLEPFTPLRAQAGRRTMRDKLWAGLSGWKHAIRGDSSFFAHGYRAFMVALTAGLLGVGPEGWITLVLASCLIFIAELNHSAIDTLARAIGDPDEPRLKVAREIAAGEVLAAVVGSATVVTVIFVFKFGDLLNWWR